MTNAIEITRELAEEAKVAFENLARRVGNDEDGAYWFARFNKSAEELRAILAKPKPSESGMGNGSGCSGMDDGPCGENKPSAQRQGESAVERPCDHQTAKPDALQSELAALREELEKSKAKLEKIRNRSDALDTSRDAYIPNALDAWGRPVPQYMHYTNPVNASIEYCNGWNDSGGYWSGHAVDLQQSLTSANQRIDVFEGLLRDILLRRRFTEDMLERIPAALNPTLKDKDHE